MNKKVVSRYVLGLGLVLVAASLNACSVFGNENVNEPPYQSLQKDKDIEVRLYAPMLLAQVIVPGKNATDSSYSAFNTLFKYIDGQNQSQTKVPMTAPVLNEKIDAQKKGQKIPMTAPVLAEQGEKGWKVSFVLPADYQLDSAPQPTDPQVKLISQPAQKMGVIRYSGYMNADKNQQEAVRLLDWLQKNGYQASGDYQTAAYNPPFTLPPFRRNEVLIPLD